MLSGSELGTLGPLGRAGGLELTFFDLKGLDTCYFHACEQLLR